MVSSRASADPGNAAVVRWLMVKVVLPSILSGARAGAAGVADWLQAVSAQISSDSSTRDHCGMCSVPGCEIRFAIEAGRPIANKAVLRLT